MLKKFWMICIIVTGGQYMLMAQDEKRFPAVTLRTNPLSLLETDGNILLGAGIHFSPRIAISVEPGCVFYHFNAADASANAATGLKLRADVRYFLREFIPYGANRFIPFVAAAFHYKNVFENRTGDFGMNCINGNCEYYQQSDYKLQRRETGALLKFGAMFPISHSRRMNAEFFAGLGARTQKFRYKNIPLGGTTPGELADEANTFPYIPLSEKVNSPTLLLSTGIKFFYFLTPSK
ncbi:MAG: hypothetical protein ACTHLE_07545 [Agriterribacter sp.]